MIAGLATFDCKSLQLAGSYTSQPATKRPLSFRETLRGKVSKTLAPIIPDKVIATLKPQESKLLKKKTQDYVTADNSKLENSIETFQQKRDKGNTVQTDTWKFDQYN